MRLAYLCTDPGIAFGGSKGASIHVGEVVSALAAQDHELLMLIGGIVPGASAPRGVTLERLPGPGKGAPVAERLRFEDDLVAWLAARLDRFRPAVLYERLALHSAAGGAVARRLGIPHLLEMNAPLLEEAARYRTLEVPEEAALRERAAITGADLVFAVSPPLVDYAARNGARRVELLQNAAALERFPPAKRNGASPVAVFCGSLRPWHGIETIAEAWRRLGPAAPSLLVIGDGPARHLLDGLRVTMTGPLPAGQVPAAMARADIGLAPYSADAPPYFSPLKVFEYLAAALATVVADLPAVTAVVDADTAIVIPPGDAVALADAVAALCADSSRRRRLGRNGRALVAAGHTWQHRATQIVEAATEMAATRAVPA